MPNLRAKTPACITTIKLSAIKFIVWVGSIVKKIISYILHPKEGIWHTITKWCYVINKLKEKIYWKLL